MNIAAELILFADKILLYACFAAGDVLLSIVIVTVPSELFVNSLSNSSINASSFCLLDVTTLSKNELVCCAVLGEFLWYSDFFPTYSSYNGVKGWLNCFG